MAKLNAVEEQIEIGSTMTHADFDICNRHRTVVICDTEGAEAHILDPKAATGLYAADILVECHPFAQADIVDVIRARFDATHDIQQIDRQLDEAALPAWLNGASDLDRLLALWEWRSSPTPWLWMTARPATQ